MTRVMVSGLKVLHAAAVLYLCFGWLLPKAHLYFHLIAIGITLLQWKLNNDQCVLTQIQHYFEKDLREVSVKSPFIESLFNSVGFKLKPKALFVIIYGTLLLSAGLSISKIIL